MFRLETERTRHAAAARVRRIDFETRRGQKFQLGLHTKHRFLMAMAVHQGAQSGAGTGGLPLDALQVLGQRESLFCKAAGAFIVREELGELLPKHRDTTGLQSDHRSIAVDRCAEDLQDAVEGRFGRIEHPEIIVRAAAAQVLRRQAHTAAGGFKNFCCRKRRLRPEIVAERVCPQDHGLAASHGPGLARSAAGQVHCIEPLAKSIRRERRQRALVRDSANPLCQRRQDGRLREKIRKAWKLCRKRGPFTDAPHAPRLTRPGVLLVIVREEFGLVGRHVGMGGAVALAAFAGEAPVEGLLDLLALPAAFHYLALKHLEKQPCAPARGIALLAGRPIARAHRPAGRRPAFAHADTVLGRAREPVAHLASERKARRKRDRLVRGALPQVVVSRIHRARATYELARVHAVFRVPDRLELAERSHEFLAVHRRKELGLRLAVAVLT